MTVPDVITAPPVAAQVPLTPTSAGIADVDAAHADPADLVRDAVLAVPGVFDLHSGAFGEVATYLPGRRVAGIRIGERPGEGTSVHIVIDHDAAALSTAEGVRAAVRPLVQGPVDVTVEDVAARR